jgi:long-chain acyl-CoA synthetase
MNSLYDIRPWLKLYPEWMPHDLKLSSTTALDHFRASADRRPHNPAVYYFDYEISYREIDQYSNSLAAALSEFGVNKGDRVALILQNVPQFLIAQYATWKLGGIVVPLNPMFKEKELLYYFKDSEAKILIILDEILNSLDRSFLKQTLIETIITTSSLDMLPSGVEPPKLLEGIKKISFSDTLDFMELLTQFRGKEVKESELSPEDIAYLTYTSGTTGPPKGAMNTHGNLVFNARVYKASALMDENDVVLGVAPLFHVTGEIAHLAVAALNSIPVILYYRFDPGETLRLLERWSATMTVASITVFTALVNHPDIKTRDISSFKKAYSGGAPISSAIVDRFESLTGLYIYNVYGMTETTSPSHITPLGMRSPVDSVSGALSVGVPIPNSIVKIVDLEKGIKELAPGEIGEIVDKGPMVVPGYWRKPEETTHAIRDGWLYTGDVGKMDDDGWFYVVDRKKDLINVSGYKVWPRDIEDVLYKHPSVREVSVVGMPDPYRGETVKAFVALKKEKEGLVSKDELITFCKERMAAFKYPRQIEFVDEIPKTLTGKFLRRALRDKAQDPDNTP